MDYSDSSDSSTTLIVCFFESSVNYFLISSSCFFNFLKVWSVTDSLKDKDVKKEFDSSAERENSNGL